MEQSKWQKAGVHRKIKQSTSALKKLKCLARKFIFRIGAESGPWPFGFVLNRLPFCRSFGHFQCRSQQLNNFCPKGKTGEKEFYERSYIYVFMAQGRTLSFRLAVNEFASFFILPWNYCTRSAARCI